MEGSTWTLQTSLGAESIQKSLDDGLIWKLQNNEFVHDDEVQAKAAAVMACTKDDQIQSLRSDLVCSIAATTHLALEGALWFACSQKCLLQLESVAFTLSMDGKIPTVQQGDENSLCKALPLAEDLCVLFGRSPTTTTS
jgi:hypothetical protein